MKFNFRRHHSGLGEIQRAILDTLRKTNQLFTIEDLTKEIFEYCEDEVVPESPISSVRRAVRSLEKRGLVLTGHWSWDAQTKLVWNKYLGRVICIVPQSKGDEI